MIFAHQLYLSFVICLPSNALTILHPPSNLTSLTTDGDYRCIPKTTPFTRAPALTDCLSAIGELPRIGGAGSFHNGLPDDPYRLPVEKMVGSCTVRVEMQHEGSSREAFSWFLLVQSTARLSRECLSYGAAGALVQFGKHRRILATVRYYKAVQDGENVELRDEHDA